MFKKILIVIVLAVGWICFTYADSEYITSLESLYNQGFYKQVLTKADSLIQNQKNISITELAQIYTYQAFSYVALDKKESAINAFRYLLIINPNLSLDPRYVSPKIIEVFEESKRRVGDTLRIKPSVLIPAEDLSNNSSIRTQAMKSLLYPGLGQIAQNKKAKGYTFLSTETISLAGLIAAHFITNNAHKKYLDNRDMSTMDELYNDYSKWYRTRTGFIISSVSIWILNYIDATIFN